MENKFTEDGDLQVKIERLENEFKTLQGEVEFFLLPLLVNFFNSSPLPRTNLSLSPVITFLRSEFFRHPGDKARQNCLKRLFNHLGGAGVAEEDSLPDIVDEPLDFKIFER